MSRLAEWMANHGEVLSERKRSNAYTGIRILEVFWRGKRFEIVDVDGMTCRIEQK